MPGGLRCPGLGPLAHWLPPAFGPRHQDKGRGVTDEGQGELAQGGMRTFLVQGAALLLWEGEPCVCKLLGLPAPFPAGPGLDPCAWLSSGPLAAPGLGTRIRPRHLGQGQGWKGQNVPVLIWGVVLPSTAGSKHRTLEPKAP